jgi:arylsulfatase A-like enzyme
MAPQGFDYSEVLIGQGPYYNPPMLKNGEKTKHIGYTTDIITDLAMNWLTKERDQEKPFMLMYQHKAPHRNWQPGPDYLNMYDDVTIPEPETLFDSYEGRGKPARTQDMSIEKTMNAKDLKLVPPNNLTPEQLKVWNAAYEPKNKLFKVANLKGKELIRWKYQRYLKDYLRCIASVDDNIGRMLAYLDETGLADNTMVIYCSDQGFYLGEHGWFDKRWMYEESLRTPFIVRWPGQVAPGTVNSSDIVSPIDFASTFCEISGVTIPDDLQGHSLVPILRGKTPEDWRTVFYYQYYEYPGAHSVRRHYGVTDGRHKLIRFYEPDVDEWEMFDLASDPNEMKSIYGDPKAAGDQARMMAELDRLRAELNVTEEDPPQSIRNKRQPRNNAKPKKKGT